MDMEAAGVARLLVLVVAVWVGLIIIRFVFPQLTVPVIRLLDRRPSQRARRMSYRARIASAFAGLRGAVSLAIALRVPIALSDGSPFPGGRDEIVFVAAGVIVLTLLVQGPLLPVVVRWANLPADDSAAAELRLAEQEIASAAVAALPDLADEHRVSEEVRARISSDYIEHLAPIAAKTDRPMATD